MRKAKIIGLCGQKTQNSRQHFFGTTRKILTTLVFPKAHEQPQEIMAGPSTGSASFMSWLPNKQSRGHDQNHPLEQMELNARNINEVSLNGFVDSVSV